jgi:glutathione S-transferase
MTRLALYFAPGSSSMAPHIALHEAAAEFEPHPISLRKGENRTPAFLALNREGKAPVLVIDGKPLTEVAAILFYIARAFPGARLLPSGDPEAEAHALSWMSFLASTVHPARRQGPEAAMKVWALAEARLDTPWCLDEGYSIADIHLFRLFWRFESSLKPDAADFPHLTAHARRMKKRAAVRKTLEIEAAIGYELP